MAREFKNFDDYLMFNNPPDDQKEDLLYIWAHSLINTALNSVNHGMYHRYLNMAKEYGKNEELLSVRILHDFFYWLDESQIVTNKGKYMLKCIILSGYFEKKKNGRYYYRFVPEKQTVELYSIGLKSELQPKVAVMGEKGFFVFDKTKGFYFLNN